MKKNIICFANSRKLNGYCFAGKDINSKNWIRPTSRRLNKSLNQVEECVKSVICPNKEITNTEFMRPLIEEDNCIECKPITPRLLDIVEISLTENVPTYYQVENYTIDNNKWNVIGRLDKSRLLEYLDINTDSLWINGYNNWHRLNNRIPEDRYLDLKDSLKLIKIDKLSIIVEPNYEPNKPNHVNGKFVYKGVEYILPITDELEEDFIEMLPNEYLLSNNSKGVVLCISIGLPYEGFIYKFISGIIKL